MNAVEAEPVGVGVTAGATSAPASAVDPKLAALRAKRSLRDREEEAEEEARDLRELELEDMLADKLGKRGKDFLVVSTPWGVWGVRKPDPQGVTQYSRRMTEFEKTNDILGLVGVLRHYIEPPEAANDFHKVAAERPFLVTGTGGIGLAFMALAGLVSADAKKK